MNISELMYDLDDRLLLVECMEVIIGSCLCGCMI